MRSPDQALVLLAKTWRRHAGAWLGGAGGWPLSIRLDAPGERYVGEHWAQFDAWRSDWRRQDVGDVIWVERRWPLFGLQPLPVAWSLPDAARVAVALGDVHWLRANARFVELIERWPALEASLRGDYALLADTDECEFERIVCVFGWLAAHPHSNLFARQLPVAGIDTKWLETRTALLGKWLRSLSGSGREADFWQVSGLRREAARLRLRVLDPRLRVRLGGLGDIQAPLEQLSALQLPASCVFVVENKQTGLAFEDLPGAVVVMGLGYAIDRLHELAWLHDAKVYYWGDIDTDGLAILGRLRSYLPSVRSLLMDEDTLLAHRELWTMEPVSQRAGEVARLDEREQALYRNLRGDRWGVRVRLEQERIAWDYAWRCIREAREADTCGA